MVTPRLLFVVLNSVVLGLYIQFNGGLSPSSHSPPVRIDFSTITLQPPAAERLPNAQRYLLPSFSLLPSTQTLLVQENATDIALDSQTALHAHFVGPHDEHFGCFLARWSNGTHHCNEADNLEPGVWNVNVTMVRTAARVQHPDCRWFDSSAVVPNTTLPLLEYILQGEFPTFAHYKRCFRYPFQIVLSEKWVKTAPESATAEGAVTAAVVEEEVVEPIELEPSARNSSICRGPEGPGIWRPYTEPCSLSGQCAGTFADELLDVNHNAVKVMRHIFAPFTCRPRFLTPKQAGKCTRDIRMAMVGDSRTYQMALAFQEWLGEDSVEFINLYKPYHLGLGYMLDKTPSGEALRAAIREGRTVIVNSLLHDLADFHRTTDIEHAKQVFVQRSSQEPACPDGVETTCATNLALECGCTKKYAIQGYLDNVKRLAVVLEEAMNQAKEAGVVPHVYWISYHRKPHAPRDQLFNWQSTDVLWEIENAAAAELESVGVENLDLRWMTTAAPWHWWDDQVHFGKVNRKSIFIYGAMQAILSKVCFDS